MRDRDYENVDTRIFSIICSRAKQKRRQYTKRILPPFLIPECNVTLENVLEYLSRDSGEGIDYEQASSLLGALDDRTIRRHIGLCWMMLSKGCLELCGMLASIPSYATVAEAGMGTTALEYLQLLVEEANKASRRMGRGAVETTAGWIWYVHAVYRCEKSRGELAVPLNSVFWALQFLDTS